MVPRANIKGADEGRYEMVIVDISCRVEDESMLPEGISFVCDWFEAMPGKRNHYTRNHYTLTDISAHRWPGTAFLRLVETKIVENVSNYGEGSSSGTQRS